ncbi:hypothetical protein BX600DRAFT_16736 [Xylariales sp. PMI_506]|nr:hypothetical protein BX600DRAFT_16736 [Xylariales sp. PMI_506]
MMCYNYIHGGNVENIFLIPQKQVIPSSLVMDRAEFSYSLFYVSVFSCCYFLCVRCVGFVFMRRAGIVQLFCVLLFVGITSEVRIYAVIHSEPKVAAITKAVAPPASDVSYDSYERTEEEEKI